MIGVKDGSWQTEAPPTSTLCVLYAQPLVRKHIMNRPETQNRLP
jgi:hypothetical protein